MLKFPHDLRPLNFAALYLELGAALLVAAPLPKTGHVLLRFSCLHLFTWLSRSAFTWTPSANVYWDSDWTHPGPSLRLA